MITVILPCFFQELADRVEQRRYWTSMCTTMPTPKPCTSDASDSETSINVPPSPKLISPDVSHDMLAVDEL